MRRLHLVLTLLLTLPLARAEVFFFGDSLSDTGNIFISTGGTFPPSPYFEGRFSDGSVWVEFLAESLDRSSDAEPAADGGNNYAVGGAMTENLAAQYSFFLSRRNFINRLNTDDLCVIWIGGNDILMGDDAVPSELADDVQNLISSLRAFGARRFLINTLPDLSALPDEIGSNNAALTRSRTILYNTELKNLAASLRSEGIEANVLDVFTLFEELLTAPAVFGFTNTTGSAFNRDTFQFLDDPATTLFWDDRHPTAAVHRLIGEAAAQIYDTSRILPLKAISMDGSFQTGWLINGANQNRLIQTFIDGTWQTILQRPPTNSAATLFTTPLTEGTEIFRIVSEAD